MEKALQLILTIDQLYYIYWYNEKQPDLFHECECGYKHQMWGKKVRRGNQISCPKCGKQNVI